MPTPFDSFFQPDQADLKFMVDKALPHAV